MNFRVGPLVHNTIQISSN